MDAWTLQPGSGIGGRPPAGSTLAAATCERLGAQLHAHGRIDIEADRLPASDCAEKKLSPN